MVEMIQKVEVSKLKSFPENPFGVRDDEDMEMLVESIKQFGVITPLIVRPTENGEYEIVSGHRRCEACKKAGIETVPAFVRELSRDEAVVIVVDSNLQREKILPSEKAHAYKMRLDAMKRQGYRSDLSSAQLGQKFLSVEMLAEKSSESRAQIQRYIRLTHLEKPLLDLVDEGRIALTPAVELSYLTEQEQYDLIETIESEEATPSHSQAVRMRRLSEVGKLSMDEIFNIMTETKGNQMEKVTFKRDQLSKYFPRHYSPKQIENFIMKLLDDWYKKKLKERNRDTGR